MTLDQIDESVEARFGDHALVPVVKSLTDYLRTLEARLAALEGAADAERDYDAEQLERAEDVTAYDVAGEAATPASAPGT